MVGLLMAGVSPEGLEKPTTPQAVEATL